MKHEKLIEILKEQHPYPKDVFIPRNVEDWERFHRILKENDIESGGFIGHACRIGYDACLYLIEKSTED